VKITHGSMSLTFKTEISNGRVTALSAPQRHDMV
jgi:hypothetical protein